MTQKEFTKAVANDVNDRLREAGVKTLSESTVGEVISSVGKVATKELARGEKIQIAGFGTFEVTKRPARTGRNPQTKKAIKIPASKAPKFKAGKALKDLVNKK